MKKGVLRKVFAKFTGKCQRLYFNKVAGLKKRLWSKCFPVRTTFFTEHLWTTASDFSFSEAPSGDVL